MTVTVDLVAKGNIASEANKAADAMDQLAKSEKRVQDIAKSLGTKDVKAVGKALDLVAKNESKAVSDKMRSEKKANALETKYARNDLKFLVKDREMQDKILQKIGPETAAALATGAELAAGVAAALAVGVVAATALGVAISSAAFEAGGARDSARGLMGVLTKGQGTKALELVDGLAEQLGMKFNVARDSFVAFRQAGLDNKQSAALLKLKADLDAVDSSGKLSAEAVSKVLATKGKGAEEQMALLAKQAGVLGNGAKAAAARFTTLGGALSSLDNTKTKALEQVFDAIAPSINKAAGQVAKFADEFFKSEKGQRIISGIGSAISKVVDLAVSALPAVGSAISGVIDAATWLYDKFQAVASAVQGNSTAMAVISAAFTGLKMIGYALAGALGVVVAGALTLAAPMYGAVAALLALTGAVGNALSYLWDLAGSVPKIGAAIIDGLIGGIMSKVANLKATIGNIAGAVSGGFKSALGINSPSKVFAQFGKHTAEGYEQGVDKHMPDGSDFASTVSPGGSAAPVASAGAATSGAGGGSGGPLINIENLNVPMGVDPEPFARAVRRELTIMLQILNISKGLPP
jgi:hypothetical protein